MTSSQERDDSFAAACVQFDVSRGDVIANLNALRTGLEASAEEEVRLAVLPEMWSTSFMAAFPTELLVEATAAETELCDLSKRYRMVIIGSSIEAEGDRLYNTARVYDNGQLLGSYRKIHLFSPNAEDRYMSAGDEPLMVETSVGSIGVIICYDLRFPDLVRYFFHRGAEILVVPGQWPEARSVHWRALLRARAIENEMFVIGCNRTGHDQSLKNDETLHFPGDSRIVDPMGEVIASGNGEEGPLVGEIELRKVRTIRRILPVARDQRPDVYRKLWDSAWTEMSKSVRPARPEA